MLLVASVALCVGIVWPNAEKQLLPIASAPAARDSLQRALVPQQRHVSPPVDCAVRACLALTCDDGPSAAVTPQILDVLNRHHVHATFFIVGVNVPGNESLLRRMYQDGHEIGNHSWSHPDFTTLTLDQLDMQIQRTQAVVVAAGVPAPTLFRPPYGAVNSVVRNRVPLTFAMWNVDPEDWRQKTGKDVADHTIAGVRAGRVVDLHDTHKPTAEGLEQIITTLQPQYQFVTFSQLFDISPGQRGAFYGR